jgi:acyl-coenzyme A thioesterase PaaI-like protein
LPSTWLNTASLTVDYFHRIDGNFFVEGEILHRSGRTMHTQIRFTDASGRLLALARATIIEQNRSAGASEETS